MKKVFCILMAALLLTMSVSSAFATKMFDQYWKPGEYTVEPTDAEKAYYNSLYETALKNNHPNVDQTAADKYCANPENGRLHFSRSSHQPLTAHRYTSFGKAGKMRTCQAFY